MMMEEFIVFDAHGSYVLDMRFIRDGGYVRRIC
jgi:hypothetical protein